MLERTQISDFQNVLSTVTKKTPVEPRIEKLETLKLLSSENIKNLEPYIVTHLLPPLLDRLDDKPEVSMVALEVGKHLISHFYL